MSSFEVIGGNKMSGTIIPQGSKNEALQVLCAVLLTKEKVTISNIPDILDVNNLIDLLRDMKVEVEKLSNDCYSFRAANVDVDFMQSGGYEKKSNKLRGAVMLAGPMLARFKKVIIPQPGGDKIGRRRIDTHILAFEKLGAKFSFDEDGKNCMLTVDELSGSTILMDEPSVTGTANIIMAAVLANATTKIYNAACEPYIQQLCKLLNNMGAKISGVGSNLITIEGVKELHGAEHRLLPDMIEIGSFIGMAALTQSDITIKNACVDSLGIIVPRFELLGIKINIKGDDIHIPSQEIYEIEHFLDGGVLSIYDHPWPGFTPDLLSIVLVTAIQARGSILIHQKMFESRLFFVDKLIDMGAQIILCDPHRAVVIGLERKSQLRGITMSSPDIRAGVALLIAALSAKGKSTIQNIEQIDRGYQQIDLRLQSLGADIRRVG